MKKQPDNKTNAQRELELKGLPFKMHGFASCEALSGVEVAALLQIDPHRVFKTLVTQNKTGTLYVFMIPSPCELDLKKAAKHVGEKNLSMIKSRDLLPLTGYIHGGCSPLGMKKQFRTVIDETALLYDEILFSGGRIGSQIEMSFDNLAQAIPLEQADITAS